MITVTKAVSNDMTAAFRVKNMMNLLPMDSESILLKNNQSAIRTSRYFKNLRGDSPNDPEILRIDKNTAISNPLTNPYFTTLLINLML